jgi:predicted metal-dependent hydrolase
VQNETKIIEEKLATFGENFDEIIDYLFENWLVVQNLKDKVSSETALKISIYAIYYAHKLKDFEQMETIIKEQSIRKWNGFIVLTRFYTMNKYSKRGLATFKSKWAEENLQNWIREEDSILKETNNEMRGLFNLMKRKCGDYLYRANLIWENLVNSKHHVADKWFLQYSKGFERIL